MSTATRRGNTARRCLILTLSAPPRSRFAIEKRVREIAGTSAYLGSGGTVSQSERDFHSIPF